MSHPEAILKCSYEYFLVWVGGLYGRLIELSVVLPQRFREALTNVEKAGGKRLFLPTFCKLVY